MEASTRIILPVLLAGLALASPAQEPLQPRILQGEEGHTAVHPPGQDDAQSEMLELFGKVERKLREIDDLLADAGSGQTQLLAAAQEAGIDQILQRALSTGRSGIEDIDRILELASQMGSQQQSQGQPQSDCSSCKSGSCSKPGHGQKSPLDRGQQSSQRESTPEGPDGKKPGEEGQEKPEGGHPDSPLASDDPNPENREGAEPPPLSTEAGGRPAQAGDRWGDLPVHVQDIFRTEGDRHMPARYRDWIDAYYRKLSARAERR